MEILIACGGRGRRLGKLSENLPKPLIKINGTTILTLKINDYFSQGFEDIVLCVGYKGDLIKKEIAGADLGGNIQFSDEGKDAGILKRIYSAKDLFGDKVILTYGDTLTNLDLKQLVAHHNNSDNEVTIVVAPIQNPFGLVEFDQNNKVTYLKEKPILNYYIGYAVINKTAFDMVPEKIINMPNGEGLIMFFKILMVIEKLGVFFHSGLQITFNTEKELERAEKQLVEFYTIREDQ